MYLTIRLSEPEPQSQERDALERLVQRAESGLQYLEAGPEAAPWVREHVARAALQEAAREAGLRRRTVRDAEDLHALADIAEEPLVILLPDDAAEERLRADMAAHGSAAQRAVWDAALTAEPPGVRFRRAEGSPVAALREAIADGEIRLFCLTVGSDPELERTCSTYQAGLFQWADQNEAQLPATLCAWL